MAAEIDPALVQSGSCSLLESDFPRSSAERLVLRGNRGRVLLQLCIRNKKSPIFSLHAQHAGVRENITDNEQIFNVPCKDGF